jgi:predicted kinase
VQQELKQRCPSALIVVSGMPASGKSSIAERLSAELGIAWINKDGLKEVVYDSLSGNESGLTSQLGTVSMHLLYHVAERHLAAGQALIIESNFDPQLAAAQVRAFQEHWHFTLVQIICVADIETLHERFKERAARGDRHPVHTDDPDVLEMAARFAEQDQPMEAPGHVLTVDTTNFATVDIAAIAQQVREALRAYAAGTTP